MSSESWHLRKELSIGTIISLLVLGAGSIAAFATVREQITHKAETTDVAVIQEQQKEIRRDIGEIKQDIKELLRQERQQNR